VIYPVLIRNLNAPKTDPAHVVFRDSPGHTNLSREPRINGSLGTTNNISATALGEYSNLKEAKKAARAALSYPPKRGRLRYDHTSNHEIFS
jgi:hypothetical protein